MAKKLKYFTLLILLISQGVKAERTSGNCSVKDIQTGKPAFSLKYKVELSFADASPGHVKIWIDVWVRTEDLYDGIQLREKTRLYTVDLKEAGKVTAEFNPLKILETTDSMTHLVLTGILERSCLDNTFIPEDDLSTLLLSAGENAKLEYFSLFLEKYHFIQARENGNYTSYLITQPDFTTQEQKPRILMVFYQNELIAIFHTREVKVKRYDSIEMGSQYKLIFNSKFTEQTKNEMVAIYRTKLGN